MLPWKAILAALPLSALLMGGAMPAAAQAVVPATPVADPMPAIGPSGISVRLVPFATVPQGQPQLIQPVGDGSGRLAVHETGGKLFLTTTGGTLTAPYLDITSVGYGGLMGVAFAPGFASSGKFYTGSYSLPGTGIAPLPSSGGNVFDMVVREWTATDPGAAAFSGTSREVLRVAQPSNGHAIGMVAFNPNATVGNADYGKLYISMGDAGDNRSYLLNGQDLSNPYGKVLRIDPTPGVGTNFTVPTDNPFVGQQGVEQTIWAYGLRNPQYLSWLRDSLPGGGAGTMLINDIGEGFIEEVNTGVAGGNYGWSIREGTFATWRDPALGLGYDDSAFAIAGGPEGGLLFPVAQYDHDEGRAIGAGLIYQGAGIPGLAGKLVATDIVNGRLFVADAGGLVSDNDPDGVVGFAELDTVVDGIHQPLLAALGTGRADARLGTDGEGNLYVLTKARGEIFRVEAFVQAVPGPGALGVFAMALLGLAGARRRALRAG